MIGQKDSVQLIGDQVVMDMLRELPKAAQTRVMKPLMRRAGKIVETFAWGEAPEESGLTKKAIGSTIVKRYRSALFLTVGVRRGFKETLRYSKKAGLRAKGTKGYASASDTGIVREPTKYLHLIARGRKSVHGNAKLLRSADGKFFGRRVREAKANPFITRAFEQSAAVVVNTITNQAVPLIQAEAAKLANR
jgi:hypothetical protein